MNINSDHNKTDPVSNITSVNTADKGATAKSVISEGEKLVAVGQQRIHVNAVTTKINDDMAFLEDRIKRMETMASPSETVLNTYRAMLKSRQSILSWLEEHHMVSSETTEGKTGT